MNILVLAAHPDDESLGCGGTIRKFHEEGHRIQLLTFTDGVGSREEADVSRNSKLEEVASILGIEEYTSGNFPDNAMDTIPLLSISKFIESNVKVVPDIIFTHFVGDLNIDHEIVAKATFTAFRPQYGHKIQVYSYFVPSSTDYNPVTYFDAATYISLTEHQVSRKLQALRVYSKEMRTFPHTRSYENVKNLMKVWGSEVGIAYCEKFKLVREVI